MRRNGEMIRKMEWVEDNLYGCLIEESVCEL